MKLFSKSEIKVIDKEKFERVLTRLIEILRDNGFSAQADAVRRILSALLKDENKKFLKTLNSIDMWGGSGAVWEVSGFETSDNEREFMSQLIELVDLMKETKIKNRRAFSIAKIFKQELSKINGY